MKANQSANVSPKQFIPTSTQPTVDRPHRLSSGRRRIWRSWAQVLYGGANRCTQCKKRTMSQIVYELVNLLKASRLAFFSIDATVICDRLDAAEKPRLRSHATSTRWSLHCLNHVTRRSLLKGSVPYRIHLYHISPPQSFSKQHRHILLEGTVLRKS